MDYKNREHQKSPFSKATCTPCGSPIPPLHPYRLVNTTSVEKMQSFSSLSLLSASTAYDMNENPFEDALPESGVETAVEVPLPAITVGMSFDDAEVKPTPLPAPQCGYSFPFRDVEFIVKTASYQTLRRVEVRVTTKQPMEVAYVAQVRIRTGNGGVPSTKVVDKDVFHFAPLFHPLLVNIVDHRVLHVHFELRFINLLERPHPKYNEGDVTLVFPDGSRADFASLLDFIYPTRMPIYKEFKGLVRAANAFQVETVLYACSRHFVDHPDWSIEKKIPEAIRIELLPALEELVYRAYQSGLWSSMISAGLQPEAYCGVEPYENVVCPTILKAKSMVYGETLLRSPWRQPQFLTTPKTDLWMYYRILVMGTPFYVNRGVLKIYGTDGFIVGQTPAYLVAHCTSDFIDACKAADATPGEVVTSLFTWLHPLAPSVPSRLLRPALLFAHHHRMQIVVEELEQLLILEPPETVERLLQNFVLAEALHLDNLLRTNLQRIDGSCQVMANEVVAHPRFAKLSPGLRRQIVDRICSGWGIYNYSLVKKQPTRHCVRHVSLEGGGPPLDEGAGLETFHSLLSHSIFGPRHEMSTVRGPAAAV
ncbi:unnamed protein product, partial [Mesorhabditis spiculigera]